MPLTDSSFQFIRELAQTTAGIMLDPGKEYLVETRLTPIANQAGFPKLDDFIERLRVNFSGTPFHDQVIEALTTNETSFFRDVLPFDALRDEILPQVIRQRASTRQLNIWSAACSTGQEAYSISMILHDHFPELNDWDVRILGTDLSVRILERARRGVFSQLEVNRGLPAALLLKHFKAEDGSWALREPLKRRVEFRQLNLTRPWPILPAFDIVFLRNVMIYFDVEIKRTILKRLRGCMHPHACLVLGAAETTLNLDEDWEPVQAGRATLYRPTDAVVRAA